MPDDRVKKSRHTRGKLKAGLCPGGAGELAEKVCERLLQDVEGLVLVAGEPPRQTDDPIPISVIKRLEGLGIALIGQFNELSVGFHMKLTNLTAHDCDCGAYSLACRGAFFKLI